MGNPFRGSSQGWEEEEVEVQNVLIHLHQLTLGVNLLKGMTKTETEEETTIEIIIQDHVHLNIVPILPDMIGARALRVCLRDDPQDDFLQDGFLRDDSLQGGFLRDDSLRGDLQDDFLQGDLLLAVLCLLAIVTTIDVCALLATKVVTIEAFLLSTEEDLFLLVRVAIQEAFLLAGIGVVFLLSGMALFPLPLVLPETATFHLVEQSDL